MRLLLAAVLLAVAAAILWTALSAVWHFPQPVYRLTLTRMAFTLGASATALAALRGLWLGPHPALALGGLVVPCLWVISFISFVGVLTLPVAIALSVVLALCSRRAGGGAGQAALLGSVLALSLAVLLFASPWIAAVDCGSGGVTRTSGRPFDSSGMSSSGSGVSSAPGGAQESSGQLGFDEESYVYRCRDGELVEFRRVD